MAGNLPAADDVIEHAVHVGAERATPAERKLKVAGGTKRCFGSEVTDGAPVPPLCVTVKSIQLSWPSYSS